MARRVSMLTNGNYWQPLNLSANAPLVITPDHQFNSVVYRFGFEPVPIEIQLAAQYSDSGDQLNFLAYLYRAPGRAINSGSCTLTVDQMTGDGVWSTVTTDAVVAVKDIENRWTASVPAADIITDECMGKTTLRVRALITRQSKKYHREIFVNHLGIAEAASYFRSKIIRLETFKKDE